MVEDKPKGLDDIKMTGGDYNEKELASFMMDGARVSNVYEVWKKYCQGRKTMVFCVTIAHAEMINADFLKHGIKSGVVHSDQDESVDDEVLYDFKNNNLEVLVNVSKLSTGYDEPSIDALIMARPTKSLILFLQSLGRGLRLFKNKKDCLVLDIANTIATHGYPTMMRDFNKVKPPPKEKKDVSFLETTCDLCGYATQMRNCRREIKEKRHITRTRWYCPNCDEIIKEIVVDNREVQRMKEIKDYTNISKISGKDVESLVLDIMDHKGYKQGWMSFVRSDYNKYPQIQDGSIQH